MPLSSNHRVVWPPRILFVEGSTGFGGSGAILLNLLRHLDRTRFSPVVATYSFTDARPMNDIRSLGIPVVALANGSMHQPWEAPIVVRQHHSWLRKSALLASWIDYWVRVQGGIARRMSELLHHENISVVVFNSDVHWHPAAVLAAKLAGKPVIVRKAGGIGDGGQRKKLLTRLVDVFVTVSEATHTDQMASAGTRRALLIPEAVEVKRLRNGTQRCEARKRLGLPPNSVIVGSASRPQEGKGHRELIQAAVQVLEQRPDVLFYIAGDEDPREKRHNLLAEFRKLALQHGILDRVIFPGWRNDMDDVFAAIDLFVHCPTTFIEGFCIVNAEAMASGLPTIVTRNGGMTDVVVEGLTGKIVEPGDIDGLATAILDLIEDPLKMREMGENARQRIANHFEIEHMTRAYEKLMEELYRSRS